MKIMQEQLKFVIINEKVIKGGIGLCHLHIYRLKVAIV